MEVQAFNGTWLLILWITFTSVALMGVIAVLVWAAREKQFSNQDAARYLPLKSGIPPAAQRSADQRTEQRHAAP